MPTITAQSIVDRAEKTLLDDTNVRWDETELLEYLNDGQREVVMFKPSAYTKNSVHQLVAGTKQTIPADGIEFVEGVRNMGVDGATPGRVVTPIRRRDLDLTRPNWHAETAAVEAKHYMFDERDPKTFYITPPQPATPGQVEILYSAAPPDVALGEVIALDDIYQTPLLYYVLSRAHAKETEAANNNRSASYYQLFAKAVGGRAAAEERT